MLENGEEVVLMPWFLIPGRPYPIQIYMYVCNLYITDPELGQRGAAKATREKFKLKKFSHSTVSRSFRSFEQCQKLVLKNRFGEELKAYGAETPKLINAPTKDDAKKEGKPCSQGRFASVADTLVRREGMAGFLPKFTRAAKRVEIESSSVRFVENWHKKTGRLLL